MTFSDNKSDSKSPAVQGLSNPNNEDKTVDEVQTNTTESSVTQGNEGDIITSGHSPVLSAAEEAATTTRGSSTGLVDLGVTPPGQSFTFFAFL